MSKKLTMVERFKLLKFLESVITSTPDLPGRCLYKDDWSDEKVAKHLDLSQSAVAYTRLEVFGNLLNAKAKGPAAGLDDIRVLLHSLDQRLSHLESQLGVPPPPLLKVI